MPIISIPLANSNTPIVPRSADEVMRLDRMGAAHQSRLSFMRQLLRRAVAQNWQFQRTIWQLDSNGVGHAVYRVTTPNSEYSLIVFSHNIDDDMRSDRVIATVWDTTFTLFDGIPTNADIQRLKQNVPYQEVGRISQTELSLSRANRSGRLFNYVVDSLAKGEQPNIDEIEAVGYLMRTTAVYGAGKFGAADYSTVAQRAEFGISFQAELLTVYLIRIFSIDIVEHLARQKDPNKAVALNTLIKQRLGIGNSTGLGMAPFIVNHPQLLHNWINAREQALCSVRSQLTATPAIVDQFKLLVQRSQLNNRHWQSSHELQQLKIKQINSDFDQLGDYIEQFDFSAELPWERLYQWARQSLSLEGQEQLNMLLIEPYAELVDQFGLQMTDNQSSNQSISGSVEQMLTTIEQYCQWAIDQSRSSASKELYWYISENKLEPRFGRHIDSDLAPLPLNIKQQINCFYQRLKAQSNRQLALSIALLEMPEMRFIAKRIMHYSSAPYMEIRDDIVSQQTMPIDMLRLKLSFFGATKFDPRSDRWVRINMFQYAPFPEQLHHNSADDWVYPQISA